MSSNVDTVRGIYEAFGRGDIPAILAVLADDVAWEAWEDNSAVRGGVPWMVERRGRDAVGSFFEVVGQMEVVDFEVLNLLEGGDEVAATFVFEAKLPNHGGGHYRDEEIHLWTFDADGKVARLRHYTDTAKHLAALR